MFREIIDAGSRESSRVVAYLTPLALSKAQGE